ncbi:MAG: hypothetical protein R2851_13405 [Caldilineaceae bacterium]
MWPTPLMLSVMAVRDDRDPAAAMLDGVHGVDFCAGLRDDALAGRRWACRAALPLRDEDEAWLARGRSWKRPGPRWWRSTSRRLTLTIARSWTPACAWG